MKQTTVGVFLNRISYSESSVIATFYTKDDGLQKFIFQGAKKKNTNLFPLNLCELTYYRRPDSELGKLTHVDNMLVLDTILSNPIKSIIAFFIADVIRNTLLTNEKETIVFQFIQQTVVQLNQTDETSTFPLFFLADFTSFIGIQPITSDEKPLYFDMKEGEFHSDYRPTEWQEEGEIVAQLFALFEKKTIDFLHRKKALEILLNYYSLHIPRFDVSKSLEIIREVLE